MRILINIICLFCLASCNSKSHADSYKSGNLKFLDTTNELFLKEWSPLNIAGYTFEQVTEKFGKECPVAKAPPDGFGGYFVYHGKFFEYRVHYSHKTGLVTKAFKRNGNAK